MNATNPPLEKEPTAQQMEAWKLHDRSHRIAPPKNFLEKAGMKLKDRLESFIARISVHPDLPVYRNETFPWVAEFEKYWKTIREELEQVLNRREDMPSFHEILSQVTTITTDDQWKTFFLMAPGMNCDGNRKQCPKTTELLKLIPGVKTAMFSILSPRKHIPAHRGPYNGVLRYHLGLIVPEPRENVKIRIADEYHHWSEGGSLVFDDTFNHEVWNDTDGIRVVLFIDFLRPLKSPWHQIHDRIIRVAEVITPMLQAANKRQKEWEKKFYRKDKT